MNIYKDKHSNTVISKNSIDIKPITGKKIKLTLLYDEFEAF